ncbi:MAG: hypothetical protein BroJett022_09520 [Actinomycetes bacterium]|nr:MAG: hypothetical protein BroJett022_09520 [Actinomycetes bacterium]
MSGRPNTPSRHLIAPLALILATGAAVALGGCGGDDATVPATDATMELPAGTLSRSELASEADALCADSTDRILAAAAPPDFGTDGPQPEEVEATAPFWRATATEGEVLVDQLSQLRPPEAEQESWDEFLKLLEAGTVDYANALLGPAEDGDPDALYQVAVDAQRKLVELNRASRELGLEVCGASDAPAAP